MLPGAPEGEPSTAGPGDDTGCLTGPAPTFVPANRDGERYGHSLTLRRVACAFKDLPKLTVYEGTCQWVTWALSLTPNSPEVWTCGFSSVCPVRYADGRPWLPPNIPRTSKPPSSDKYNMYFLNMITNPHGSRTLDVCHTPPRSNAILMQQDSAVGHFIVGLTMPCAAHKP